MRLNIFRIPQAEVEALRIKLSTSRMEVIKEVDQDGWHGVFYYSSNPIPGDIPWVDTFRNYFDGYAIPQNINYYAVFLFEKGSTCYALSFGKAHFYLRPHSDYDFGIELAKRVADETDIKQTASKRFQGKKKKDIKSYASNTRLDVESGESVEFLQSSIVEQQQELFGKSGKFGNSALLTMDRIPSEIGDFLTKVEQQMALPARFKLPRTTIVTEQSEIDRYDQMLTDELMAPVGTTDFSQNSYDLYGIDFVFTNNGTFKVWCPGHDTVEYEDLKISNLKDYIRNNSVRPSDVLKIRVQHLQEGRPHFTNVIKECVDFIADADQVLLTGGKWMRFNQDYLDFLNEYLSTITVEETEAEFADIYETEPNFNASEAVLNAGYEVADKNFTIFRTLSSTPIEAWDLKKGLRVYAVKFDTPQKLNYVVDQSTAVLELLRNKANVNKVPEFKEYCLWLGYRAKNRLENINDTGSIILKQKIEAWARKCRELGIEPVIKISRKLKRGVDDV